MTTPRGFASIGIIIAVVVLAALGGGAYVAANPGVLATMKAEFADDGIQSEPGDHQEIDREANEDVDASVDGKVSIAWKFEDDGEGAYGEPFTKVTAVINGIEHKVGTYTGTCAEIGSGQSVESALLTSEGEVAGATCYYGGSGNEIGIFRTASGLAIKVGELAEPAAESGSFRGNFNTKLDLILKQ